MPQPLIQELEDRLLYPCGGEGFGEVFAQLVQRDIDTGGLGLFMLHHDLEHIVLVQLTRLTEPPYPLGLGYRWGGLFAVHRFNQEALLRFGQRRDLIGRRQGDALLTYYAPSIVRKTQLEPMMSQLS